MPTYINFELRLAPHNISIEFQRSEIWTVFQQKTLEMV